MKIHIIGNGFDLYHGLPSKYSDFANWLIKHDEQLYSEMSNFFESFDGYRRTDRHDPEEREPQICEKFWSVFEENLGNVKTDSFEEQLMDDLSLEYPSPVSIKRNFNYNSDEIARKIKEKFAEWVFSSIDNAKNYRVIQKQLKSIPLLFDDGDYFITFNYTHSLQKIYSVKDDRILYIHGECTDKDSNLIVGHGKNKKLERLSEKISESQDIHDKEYTQATLNRLEEYELEYSFVHSLQKDTTMFSCSMARTLNEMQLDVSDITVYGFSFGDVDLPYICQLISLYPTACWHISEYETNEENERGIIDKIQCASGADTFTCDFFEFSNPKSEVIRSIISSDK